MGHLLVHRPARARPPLAAAAEVVVKAPPQVPPPSATNGPMAYIPYLLPALAGLGSVLFMVANPRPLFIVAGSTFAVSAVAAGLGMVVQMRTAQTARRRHERIRYLEYLDRIRDRLGQFGAAQLADARYRDVDPEALWQVTALPDRLWERRPTDPDFLTIRVARGTVALAARPILESPSDPLSEPDPVCQTEAERLVGTLAVLTDAPVSVPLRGVVSLVGPRAVTRGVARAMVAQVAAWHAAEEVRVAVVVSRETAAEWTWVKWLPHCLHPSRTDASGPVRLVCADPAEARSLLLPELDRRHQRGAAREAGSADPRLVVVVDRAGRLPSTGDLRLDAHLAEPADLGVSVVHLVEEPTAEPSHVDLRLRVEDADRLRVEGAAPAAGAPDRLDVAPAETLARRLAPLRLSPDRESSPAAGTVGLTDALGFDVRSLDPARAWQARSEADLLRVPIGTAPDGQPVHLDLKESARGGMGPHGILVGATGSGKSELLRTLVVSLAATHPPERLALVLVDFKGGAAFAGLAGLPHVAGMITNLQDDLVLVDRVQDALRGELVRRQELLRAAGNVASTHGYDLARAAGAPLTPLPSLLIVVDEFSELLSAQPEFIDVFVSIGRVGRALGIHLLLASQRLEEGRLRGLEGHLSYRIGLRTFSAIESRIVLGVPDAYELPPVPGSGYLKVDAAFQRFRAAYVSGPMPSRATGQAAARPRLLPFTASNLLPPEQAAGPFIEAGGDGPTVLSTVVERLRDAAPRAHQVWLPPLDRPPTLDALLPGIDVSPDRGLQATGWPAPGGLRVPLGLVDRPRAQRVDPFVVDLSGANGNVGLVGGPRSGRTTALRTLVASFALTHTPAEAQFYCVDLGGGLAPLGSFPHVGGVASRLEPELVRRVVAEMTTLLETRARAFRTAGIDSAAAMRARRSTGTLPERTGADVFLVIDGWSTFHREFEDLEATVLDLGQRGLGYGIHLVLTANRWFDIKPALKDTLGARMELRMGEPLESEVDRKQAAKVPVDRPGRGLTPDRSHCQFALPRTDGLPSAQTLPDALADLASSSTAAWQHPPAPPVRMLPPKVGLADLPASDEPGVPVGLGEFDLSPVHLDLSGAEPHFVVYGDSEAGKTTFLRTFLTGLVRRHSPDAARVIVADYRRTLLDAAPETHLLAYAGSATALGPIVADVLASLTLRLPGPDVTAAQLRERSWWHGPDVYLVVDDHDLTVTPAANPLLPLVDLLPQARDIGLHLILARRVTGTSRAAYEGVLQRLRDLGTPGLILSGQRAEGPIVGPHRAAEQPPGRGLLVTRARTELVQVAVA